MPATPNRSSPQNTTASPAEQRLLFGNITVIAGATKRSRLRMKAELSRRTWPRRIERRLLRGQGPIGRCSLHLWQPGDPMEPVTLRPPLARGLPFQSGQSLVPSQNNRATTQECLTPSARLGRSTGTGSEGQKKEWGGRLTGRPTGLLTGSYVPVPGLGFGGHDLDPLARPKIRTGI